MGGLNKKYLRSNIRNRDRNNSVAAMKRAKRKRKNKGK